MNCIKNFDFREEIEITEKKMYFNSFIEIEILLLLIEIRNSCITRIIRCFFRNNCGTSIVSRTS